jgi:hypothetical protein
MNEKLWLEMAQEIRTQDNACTAEPIYVVQQRKRMYGIDPDLCDDGEVVWLDCMNDHDEIEAEEAKKLEDTYNETLEVPENYTRTGYMDTWEFVQPFFTKKGAEEYIEANRHRLTDPRIYVDSAYRNKEWQEVRNRLTQYSIGIKQSTSADAFAPFEGMRLGNPVYFWFEEEDADGGVEYVIKRVVGEPKSSLWTDDRGYGVRITEEMAAKCHGRVILFDQIQNMLNEIEKLKKQVGELTDIPPSVFLCNRETDLTETDNK